MATTASGPLTAEKLFDSVGPAYEDAFANYEPQTKSIKWVLSQLQDKNIKPAKIVDIGCGTGRPVCAAFADAGHDVLGIDVSTAMLDAAKKRVPNAKFEKLDVRAFKPEQESLDVITVYFSMLASMTQDDIKQSIERFVSWLKPGGLFVYATVPMAGNNLEIKWMGLPLVTSSLDPDASLDCISKAGFDVVHQETCNFLPKAVEAGICGADDVWEEPHLFVYAKKR